MIGEVAALGAALCWAVGSHLFSRIGREVPAGAMNLGKCATALAMFTVTALAASGKVVPALPAGTLPWLVASGVVGLAIGDSAYFSALVTLGVRRALLLLSTAPVFAAVGGALFLGERLGLRDAAAIAAVMAGVVVVVNEQETGPAAVARGLALTPRASAVGVLYGLIAGVAQAAGSLMSRFAMSAGVGSRDTAIVRLMAGVGAMILLAGATGRLAPWGRTLGKPRLLLAITGSAFVGTYCGMWLSQVAIGRAASTAIAATLLATSPIFALPLGRWLGSERITLRALGGTALAVAGLAALTLGKS
jgi:drug/metabolite transporter (DMT)-like permease